MIRTIIVDDEILSRIGIRTFIDGKEDIAVSDVFGDAEDALEYLRGNPVDVVITDIEMAGMDGLSFISRIREENLAGGIIILSCHDDFSYAQEAISRGTNSYLLKVDIEEEMLIREIQKVYKATKPAVLPDRTREREQKPAMEDGVYEVGILRMKKPAQLLDGTMVFHLLEEVIERHQMGTVFLPYNKELFVIFQYDRETSRKARKELLSRNLHIIGRHMSPYINEGIIFGISPEFTDLTQTNLHYEEARAAADLDFYDLGDTVYIWQAAEEDIPVFPFSTASFTGGTGMEIFAAELGALFEDAQKRRFPVERFRENLIQSLNNMVYQVLQENFFREEFLERWNLKAQFVSLVSKSDSIGRLEKELMKLLEGFRFEVLSELQADEFTGIFQYIEQNLEGRIALSDLAGVGCMSTAYMCRKFKERMGITIVQYVNEKRVERAKLLMKNQNYSLWQIADRTGFANVNYMIRVFKKVTGLTIGEYRKQAGLGEIMEGVSGNTSGEEIKTKADL